MLADNAKAARKLYPEAEYRLWSQSMLRAFIAETFAPEVSWAFEKLQPYSYKSDLARFCLLHHFGGLYVDLGVRLADRWDIPPDCGLAAFRDVPFVSRSWSALQTGLIWAKPGRKEFLRAIDLIVENCRNAYYGSNPLYPTGPVVLGRACIAAMVDGGRLVEDHYIGECRCLTPDSDMLNLTYVSREGLAVAFRTKRIGGDLSHMGLERTNNYNDLWRSRQAYGETVRRWRGDDPLLEPEGGAERVEGGVRVGEGVSGRVLFGPYVDLDAGSYRLRIAVAAQSPSAKLSVECCAGIGSAVLRQFEANVAHAEQGWIEFPLVLEEPRRSVEFRVSTDGDFIGIIEAIEVRDEPRRTWSYDDPRIGVLDVVRDERGIVIPRGASGRVMYGPYATLKPGAYRLDAIFAAGLEFSKLRVEICCDGGSTLLDAAEVLNAAGRADPRIRFEFNVARLVTDAEFRLEVFGDFDGLFQSFELTQVAFEPTQVVEAAPAKAVSQQRSLRAVLRSALPRRLHSRGEAR